MNRSKRTVVLVSIIFLIAGPGLLTLGILLQVSYNNMRQDCTMQTVGKVADLVEHVSTDSDGDEEITYSPVFEFSLDGECYTKRTSASSALRNFYIGQTVTVFYNPADPQQFYVSEYVIVDNIRHIALISIGGVVILYGGYCAVRKIRSNKSAK